MNKTQVSILLAVCITVIGSLCVVFVAPASGQFNIVIGEQRVVGEVLHLDDSHRVAHARAGFIGGSEAVYINGLRLYRGTHYRVVSRPGHVILTFDGRHGDLIIIDYTRR